MNFIVWIIIGGLAGWIAGMIMKNQSGLFMNIIIGVVGAFIGGWLFNILQIAPQGRIRRLIGYGYRRRGGTAVRLETGERALRHFCWSGIK